MKILCGLTLIFTVFCANADSSIHSLDFKESLAILLERSPRFDSAKKTFEIQNLNAVNAKRSWFPILDLKLEHGLKGEDNSDEKKSGFANALTLRTVGNLYNNGTDLIRVDSTSLRVQMEELNLRLEKERLTFELYSAFLRFSDAQYAFEIQIKQNEIINREYKNIFELYQQGLKPQKDYLRFKAELKRSELELLSSKNLLRKAEIEILKILGLTTDSDLDNYHIEALPLDLDYVGDLPNTNPSLFKNLRYMVLGLQSKINKNEALIVKSQNSPEITLTTQGSFYVDDYLKGKQYIKGNKEIEWAALLSVKFNLIDWGIADRKIEAAILQSYVAENKNRDEINDIISKNEALYLDILEKNSNYILSKELLKVEQKNYSYIETDYREGRASYLDLIFANRDLLDSKVQIYRIFFELKQLLAQFKLLEGELYDSFFNK